MTRQRHLFSRNLHDRAVSNVLTLSETIETVTSLSPSEKQTSFIVSSAMSHVVMDMIAQNRYIISTSSLGKAAHRVQFNETVRPTGDTDHRFDGQKEKEERGTKGEGY